LIRGAEPASVTTEALAQMDKKVIPSSTGYGLITDAKRIRTVLGCR
jgi:hypothetical protein